ncbi:MAG: hypothetical protein HY537_03175, partial [Deltaproteobacteria bacterium]|nr:hypothetical protein [Deltaproteobacteria bacterium]
MIGRRKNLILVESSTNVADKTIDLHAWRDAKKIHEIALHVEGPGVKVVDVYEEVKELYGSIKDNNEPYITRPNQLFHKATHRTGQKVVL